MIIDFYKGYGGGGSGSGSTEGYWNSAQTKTYVDSADTVVYASATSYADAAIAGIDLSNYALSADVETLSAATMDKADKAYVDSAITDLNERVEEISGQSVDLSAYYTSAQTEEAITARGYVTSGQVKEQVEAYNYVNSGQVETQITGKGYATEEYVQDALSGVSLSDYYTSAQTEEAITSKNYVTSAQVETQITDKNYITSADTKAYVDSAVTEVSDHLYEVEEVTASAITYLDGLIAELSGTTPDLSAYALSADVTSLSAATAGKADAANVTANTDNLIFPKWNKQGIIQGVSQQVFRSYLDVNGAGADNYFFMNSSKYDTQNKALKIYTPLSAGTAGEVLVSTGNGAPVWSAFTGGESKTVVDFDKTPQSERVTLYTTLKALYDGGSGATINKTYDFYKTVGTKQGLKIDYYTFSGNTMIFGKVVSPDSSGETAVYAQVLSIDSAGNVNVTTNAVGGGTGTGYWTSAETKTYVDSAVTGVQDQIDTMDEVVSAALNDLNGRVAAISAATQDMVTSTNVRHLVKLTQAEYDALTNSGATADPYTFYIISNSN